MGQEKRGTEETWDWRNVGQEKSRTRETDTGCRRNVGQKKRGTEETWDWRNVGQEKHMEQEKHGKGETWD